MKRVRLRVAYDGTNYSGWQIQPNGRTIEGELDQALTALTGENIHVIGASRTDAGVHALGNVAVFDTEMRMPGEKYCFALNTRLPEDIVVQASDEVAVDWHPRHQDCRKTYEYRVQRSRFANPQTRRYTHLVYGSLDVAAMREAAAFLVGTHDFTSFCSVQTPVEDKVRTIYSLEVLEEGELLILRVCGNGFLYNMVRIIAGTLLQVGSGLIKAESIPEILEAKDRTRAGATAPAKGLTLCEVCYDQEV